MRIRARCRCAPPSPPGGGERWCCWVGRRWQGGMRLIGGMGADLTATLALVSPFSSDAIYFVRKLVTATLLSRGRGWLCGGGLEVSLVVGGVPLVPGQWTPPGLKVGCRRWCHGVVGGISLPSPPISGATARCSHQNHRPPTRWHTGTAHCHGCRSSSSLVGLRPLPELQATLYRGRPYCEVCVCEPGPLPFSLDPFFSALFSSHTLRPPRIFSLSVPPVPISFSPVLLYPVTAQFFGTPRGRSSEKASPLPVHCRV